MTLQPGIRYAPYLSSADSSLLSSGYEKNSSAYGGTSSLLRRALVSPLNATITAPLNAPLNLLLLL